MKLPIPNTRLSFELQPIGSPVICYRILVNGSRSEISKLVYTEVEAREEIQNYLQEKKRVWTSPLRNVSPPDTTNRFCF